MSIFSRNSNQRGHLAKKSARVRDFSLRALKWDFRTASYQIYAPFSGFLSTIDRHLQKLFLGEIDAGNKSVLDQLIGDMARQAESDLALQREEHLDVIQTYQHRREPDKLAFELERQRLQEILDQTNQERVLILTRLESKKFKKEEMVE